MLVHQLPAKPSNLRVRTWRRLQELGAVALKQSVYVLPDAAEAREDFEWLKVEIEGSGGEAAVFHHHREVVEVVQVLHGDNSNSRTVSDI